MTQQSLTAFDKQIQHHLNKREFKQADDLLKKKDQKEPKNPDTFYLKGVYHYFQGEILETIKNLKQALKLDPKHTDAAICLSVLYNDIGKYDEAKAVFETANRSILLKDSENFNFGIDKKFAVKHLELADLYMRYRRYDESIEEYTKAILLDPQTPELKIRRAKAYAKKGFMTRSIQELQQLKKEYPQFTPTKIQLGLLYYSQGNILDAELEWEEVLKQNPNDKEAKTFLEMSHSKQKT